MHFTGADREVQPVERNSLAIDFAQADRIRR